MFRNIVNIPPAALIEPEMYSGLESFSCPPGCTACCRGVLSVSIPELMLMANAMGNNIGPPHQIGCPFRISVGCAVYSQRPFMCRFFGFQFVHPDIRGRPFCPKFQRIRPGDQEVVHFKKYKQFCDKMGFVFLGEPCGDEELKKLLPENQEMVKKFPELVRFGEILTGRERCWENL